MICEELMLHTCTIRKPVFVIFIQYVLDNIILEYLLAKVRAIIY